VSDLKTTPTDAAAAWDSFCETLLRAGQQILRPETPRDALSQAEGFRYLSRLTRLALEMNVESGTPEFPTFMVPSHETAKIGADNPDNLYQLALISGQYEYRVRGHRGDAENINFSTKRGGYGIDGKLLPSDAIQAKNMQFAADGSFELILSQQRHPGNWLRLTPDTTQFLVRQYLPRRHEQTPAQLSIECINTGRMRPPPLDPARFDSKLRMAAAFVENTAQLFADWAQSYQPAVNTLPFADQALCQSVGGDPNILYYHGFWKLSTDQALVIHIPYLPECDFWNVVIQNYWMESLDFRYGHVCINKETAHYEADGSIKVIFAARDPGHPNWLDTAGHPCGTMCFRLVGAKTPTEVTTRLAQLDTLTGAAAI